MKLNKAAVAAIELPRGEPERVVWDDDVAGFGLRTRAGGITHMDISLSHRPQAAGDDLRLVSAMTAQQAREHAVKLHAQVRLGLDPAAGKIESQARASEIFEYAVRLFLAGRRSASSRAVTSKPNAISWCTRGSCMRCSWPRSIGVPLP